MTSEMPEKYKNLYAFVFNVIVNNAPFYAGKDVIQEVFELLKDYETLQNKADALAVSLNNVLNVEHYSPKQHGAAIIMAKHALAEYRGTHEK